MRARMKRNPGNFLAGKQKPWNTCHGLPRIPLHFIRAANAFEKSRRAFVGWMSEALSTGRILASGLVRWRKFTWWITLRSSTLRKDPWRLLRPREG
jgi:hypothetical protein